MRTLIFGWLVILATALGALSGCADRDPNARRAQAEDDREQDLLQEGLRKSAELRPGDHPGKKRTDQRSKSKERRT